MQICRTTGCTRTQFLLVVVLCITARAECRPVKVVRSTVVRAQLPPGHVLGANAARRTANFPFGLKLGGFRLTFYLFSLQLLRNTPYNYSLHNVLSHITPTGILIQRTHRIIELNYHP